MQKYFGFFVLPLLLSGAGCQTSLQTQTLPGEKAVIERVAPEPAAEEANVEEDIALNVSLKSGNFFFDPAIIRATPGQTVNLTFSENSGSHTFVIDEINFKQNIQAGTTMTFTAPSQPGSYAYYCDVGSHRALGMEGVLIVE